MVVVFLSLIFIFHHWVPIQNSNRSFLNLIDAQISKNPDAKSVLVMDYSGYLGDVITFYGSSSLEDILTEGNSLLAAIRLTYPRFESAIICTPESVSRIHPAAKVFPLPTTKDCGLISTQADMTFNLSSYYPVRLEILPDKP